MEISFFMSYIETSFLLNIFLFFTLFFLNFFVPIYIAKKFKLKLYIPIIIVCINFIFYTLYMYFEELQGSDGLSFYTEPFINNIYPFYVRDPLIIKLTLMFKDLKVHYLNVTFFTNIISTIAFLLIYIKFNYYKIIVNFKLFILFFLVCNSGMLFWANGILKENFIFFAIVLFLFSIKKDKIDFKFFLPAIILCLLFRPLIGFFMILSVLIFYHLFYFLNKKYKDMIRLDAILIIPFGIFLSYIFSQYNLKLNFTIFHQILDQIYIFSSSYQDPEYRDGLLTYDTSELFFFQQYFMYYFSPIIPLNPIYIFIFLSIQNITNLTIFIIFTYLIYSRFKLFKKFIKSIKFQNIFFIYFFIFTLIVPLTCFNLGIAFRQKWMGLVIATYYMLFFISFCRKEKMKKNKKS